MFSLRVQLRALWSVDRFIANEVDLCDTFIANSDVTELSSVSLQEKFDPVPVSAESDTCKDPVDLPLCPEKLIAAQRADISLAPLFELVETEQESISVPQAYFLKNEILIGKWVCPKSSDDWNTLS